MDGTIDINREAADPSMIFFRGKYYIFASMTLDVQVSEDLVHWERHPLPEELPLYGYAPDACVYGDYVYICANESEEVCHFYRTKDILEGPYEKIEGTFAFSDPCVFADDDGRIYFYWGLSCKTPIYGVELDPKTMRPLGDVKELIWGNPFETGYERIGEDNTILPLSPEELETQFQGALRQRGIEDENMIPKEMAEIMKDILRNAPYIEGAWMNKFRGKYYLQYAAPGTHFNVYSDGVYVSDQPLGPFVLADNNPYSFKPGGFFPGAGHGSTMEDEQGHLWHASTMRISLNHQFERRIGLWPAGIDEDGELFCNQRYGDWPMAMQQAKLDPWADPSWYLLSYGRNVEASSATEGHEPSLAADENVRTWWQAAGNDPGQWILMDLGKVYRTHAVQINFADDKTKLPLEKADFAPGRDRYIEGAQLYTRWVLEGSLDGEHYEVLCDKSKANTDLAHDLYLREEGFDVRYLKLTILEVPYGQNPCISGLRVFGVGDSAKPKAPEYRATRAGDLDMDVTIWPEKEETSDPEIPVDAAVGYNILWGSSPEKLYHSYMIFGKEKRIGALVKGRSYYVRVDAFNENGITEGTVQKVM